MRVKPKAGSLQLPAGVKNYEGTKYKLRDF
jgi:hypothetical protein